MRRLSHEHGFTMIEVMVAAMVLLVGLVGTMAMIDGANATTSTTQGREGATNLAREIVEEAQTIPYQQLAPGTVLSKLQAMPGLADAVPGGNWEVRRRTPQGGSGFTYNVALTLCSIDDSKDKGGDHAPDPGIYCPDSTAANTNPATADAQPEDFKRLALTITYSGGNGTQTVGQTAIIGTRGSSDAASIKTLTLPGAANPTAPLLTSNPPGNIANFKATTAPGVYSVVWSVDGVDKGTVTTPTNGTDWTLPVDITGLTDGDYDIGARAVDARGIAGPTQTITLTLIRGAPAAPSSTGLVAGYNKIRDNGVTKDVVELDWLANSERNVVGYRVYRGSTLVCPTSTTTLDVKTSCIDFNPPAASGTPVAYSIRALYYNASGTLAESAPTGASAVGTAVRRFYLKNTTANTGTGCYAATLKQDMEEGFAGVGTGAIWNGANNQTLGFCSIALAAGTQVAGPARAVAFFSNTNRGGGSDCNMAASVGRMAGTTRQTWASAPATIPFRTGTTPNIGTAFDFTIPATTLATGDRINLIFQLGTINCDGTYIGYGGTQTTGTPPDRARLELTLAGNPPPDPPTNLTGAAQPDGTTQLNWTPPATLSSKPVLFYRIYRQTDTSLDARDYTQRLDHTGQGTDATYTDSAPITGRPYYVTAVGPDLSESAPVGPVSP